MSYVHRSLMTVLVVLALAATSLGAESELTVQGGGMPWGPAIYRAKVWATVTTLVANPTGNTVEALVVTSLEQNPGIQFATPVWLPPFSRYRVVQPVYLYSVNQGEGFMQEAVTTQLIDPTKTPEQRLSEYDGPLSVNVRYPIVAFIGDGSADDKAQAMTSFGAAVGRQDEPKPSASGRVHLLRLKTMLAQQAPRFAAGWDGIEALVIAQNRPQLDAAQIDAIRGWLSGGGRLWVLLDQVPSGFCARLLGEDFTCTVVDRVKVSRLNVVGQGRESSVEVELDQPADLVRMLAPGYEVMHTVNGWPVSMRQSIGRGRVILTTLGPRAWLDDRDKPLAPLRDLEKWFADGAEEPRQAHAVFQAFNTSQIGHTVVGRSAILVVFVLFTVLLLGAGIWLSRRSARPGSATGGLEYIGFVGIGLSLTATFVLAALGKASHGQTPPTVSIIQVAEVSPSGYSADVTGDLGFYTPESRPMPIEATAGGLVWHDAGTFGGASPRMVWTDFDRWRWELPDLNPGAMQTAILRGTAKLDERVTAQLEFAGEVLRLRVAPGPFGDLADPVLATVNGHLVPQSQGGNEFVIPGGQDLVANEFFAGGMSLTTVQEQRQDMYRRLHDSSHSPATVRYSEVPALLVWTSSPVDLGINYMPGAERREAALVTIPVEVVRPEPGTQVSVPGALIPYFTDDPLGKLKGGLYDSQTHEWVDAINAPKRFALRFQLPRQVVPLQIDRAELTVTIKADGWKLALFDPFSEDSEPLDERVNPRGSETFDLAKWPELIKPDEAGAIYVRFHVSPAGSGGGQKVWGIREMSLQVGGRTLAPAESDAPTAAPPDGSDP